MFEIHLFICIKMDSALNNLQYNQTKPIQNIGLFPVQLQLLSQLYDFLPSQYILYKLDLKWITAAQSHVASLYQCNAHIMKRYNGFTHNLYPLQKGYTVAIQNQFNCQWNITDKVIMVLPDHQYWIRVNRSGRITLRNCWFFFQTISTL